MPDNARTSLAQLSARDTAAQVRSGEISVSDVAEAIIARYEQRNAAVQAFAYFDAEYLREQARQLDAAATRGPLHGVPIAIKDVIDTKDMPTEHNSVRYRGSRPGVDASCVDTLRQAGALFVGKTVTTEFAASNVGGPTRNPHDPARTPGGSSSGSAAAVADFQAALALGTQTGGSTIRPASFTGSYGWKPTWNSISREGVKMFSATCDTVGLFARTATDLALLADVFDLDPPQSPAPLRLSEVRIGVCRSPAWPTALAATQQALALGAQTLSAAGGQVSELDLPPLFDGLAEAHRIIITREGRSAFLGEYRAAQGPADTFQAMVENQSRTTPAQCRAAYELADRCRAAIDGLLGRYDVLLTPSATGEAPLGLESTGDAAFNSLWTVLQVPVVTVPGHTGPAGLPVGLSLVGRRYEDRRVLAIAELVGAEWAKMNTPASAS